MKASPPTNYADTFGYQWNQFRSTQLDSCSGIPLSFERFWRWTGWKPKDLYGARVLEAGSGAGRFTEVMLDAGARVVTFDYSSAIFANRDNNAAKGDVSFLQADMRKIPFPENAFDFVFCYGVIQHLPEPRAAVDELARVLKPGGRMSVDFYIKTNRLDPFNQPKYFWRRWSTKIPHERLLRIIKRYMPYWLPVDTVIRRVPLLGPKLLGFLRIPCWNYTRFGLTRKQRLEWAILDTFDALSAVYDKPFTKDDVETLAVNTANIAPYSVAYGSNGIVLNATKV